MTPSPPYGVTAPTDSGSLFAGTLVHSGRQRSEEGRIIPKLYESRPLLSGPRIDRIRIYLSTRFENPKPPPLPPCPPSPPSPPLLVVRGLLLVPRYSAYRPEKPPREKENLLTAFADTFNREELHPTFTNDDEGDDDDDDDDEDDYDDDDDDDVGMLSSCNESLPPQLPSPIPPSNRSLTIGSDSKDFLIQSNRVLLDAVEEEEKEEEEELKEMVEEEDRREEVGGGGE
ncbi:hypothetical protein V1478_002563 [Vespula squamosa]|uniref:Uncharacterized protein n=1 Tax=Vespula squamosa TaxID=30214 RepID=A0ABD2BSX5_VESSQ